MLVKRAHVSHAFCLMASDLPVTPDTKVRRLFGTPGSSVKSGLSPRRLSFSLQDSQGSQGQDDEKHVWSVDDFHSWPARFLNVLGLQRETGSTPSGSVQAERFAEHMEQGVFLWTRYSGLDAPGAAADEINKSYARRCGVSVGPRFNQEVPGFINFSAGDVDARMRNLLVSAAKADHAFAPAHVFGSLEDSVQDSSLLLKLKKLEEKKQHPACVHRYMFSNMLFPFTWLMSIILAGNCKLVMMMHMATIASATC